MRQVTTKKVATSKTAKAILVAFFTASTTVSEAALLNLSETPLYLITAVEPNILLTFDDSGSMAWGFLPDSIAISGLDNARRGCSSTVNRIYYDPTVTYDPPVKENGAPLNTTPTSFTAAYTDGFNTASGTVNLATSYRVTWDAFTYYGPTLAGCGWSGTSTLASGGTGTNTNARPAFYFTYNGSSCGPVTNNTCYTLVQHGNPTAWTTAEQQNFANWYSYYRTRNLLAKTAAGRAFSRFGTNVRVAGQHINNTTSSTTRFTKTIPIMKQFSGSNRTDFFTRLYNSPTSGGTSLRDVLEASGEYFGSSNTGANSPYRDSPGSTSSPERSCRQNFHVLMTDGYWNGTAGVSGNIDGASRTLGDGTAYTAPKPPYSDSTSGTLADNAFHYWYRDLRTDLTNNVRAHYSVKSGNTAADKTKDYWNPANDPATWQHLVNFTIGLGIDGSLPFNATTYNNLVSGTQAWPAASADSPSAVDDLWHSAINSRGDYFSASNPTELVSAFLAVVNNVAGKISSSASVSLNSGSLSTNSFVYQSKFNSGDWSGQLLSYKIQANGLVDTKPTWDAAQKLNTQDFNTGRMILTSKPSTNTGIPFRWPSVPASPTASELDANQISALNFNPITATTDAQGGARLNYLRGDASNESAGNNYRTRKRDCGVTIDGDGKEIPNTCPPNTGVLGDAINSAPLYVGPPPFLYPDSISTVTGQEYSKFRTANKSRRAMIYVGANDGMLHGIDAATGLERFAYVPSPVYSNLSRLPSTPYIHRYFVDGSPVAVDAFLTKSPAASGGEWKTVLVGGLRKGGQGIYALDVTNPDSVTEGSADKKVLWEFTDAHDADLGYTYSLPTIVKMANGKWAVVMGNGYNNSEADGNASTTGRGVLYILFIEDGTDGTWASSDFVKIDTGVGTTGTPNGLASPAIVDTNGDYVADFIYAGDLQGNLWKFDVRSTNPNQWTNSANIRKLFTAKDSAGIAQPITSRPQVGRHPAAYPGFVVYFGTGKYLETADASISGATTQTFYGIWDDFDPASNVYISGLTAPFVRANLQQQTVTNTVTSSGQTYRAISNNIFTWRTNTNTSGKVGWYLDLPDTGERQVTDSILRNGAIIFTTVIPSTDPCTDGGDGWLMELNATNGGRLAESPFDINGDGSFSTADFIASGTSSGNVSAGGQKIKGIPSAPAVLITGNPSVGGNACNGNECKLLSTSAATIESVTENTQGSTFSRKSWR